MINFLTGSLFLRTHKTGVHLLHENIIRQFSDKYDKKFKISVYDTKKNMEKIFGKNIPYLKYLEFSCKFTRILIYLLPIEIFFGKSDIYFCDGIIPLTLYKSKKIGIVHDLMVYMYPDNYSFIRKVYLKYYFWSLKRADYIVAVSETTKSDIIKYLNISSDKIKVIYCGVDNIESIENSSIKNMLKEKFIFYLGDFRANKNIISAIKGFEKYKEKYNDNMKFYLAGSMSGIECAKIQKYVYEKNICDDVVFLGYISEQDKVALYLNAHAFVFVSLYEGFGIPIIESMNYGCPVITSNCSSMKEIATNNSAILVDPHDIDGIAEAIHKFNSVELRNSIIKNGHRRSKIFNWENVYNRLCEVFNKCN